MKRILFSPVGSTDPIAHQRDGALLHIIRKYRPDKAYLFFSKEIYGYEQKDNRYSYCLNKLLQEIGEDIEIEWIIKEDLVDVQLFDPILLEFKEIIEDLCKCIEDDDELLVNVSSGSPAMKSAVQILAAFTERPVIPVQVDSPNKAVNTHEDVKGEYSPEIQWELNLDNSDETYEDRCRISSKTNLNIVIRKSIIRRHIEAYDYRAALDVANNVKNYIDENAIALMEAGSARLKLDKSNCEKKAKVANYDIYPIKQGDHWNVFEYLMIMRIKLEKEEYADFIRSISPVFQRLLEMIIKKTQIIDLDSLIRFDKRSGSAWVKETNKYVKSFDYIAIIDENGKGGIDLNIKKIIYKIRDIEESVRNRAAHNITCITDESICNLEGKNSKDIFKMLCELSRYAGIKITDEDLKTYDKLNEKIISVL